MSHRQPFLNIRTEGSLLPSDLLSRLMEGTNLPGLKPEDYNLGAGEKLNEAISRSWTRLLSLWLGFRKAKAALPASDLGTTLTRERWLLQLFQELGYGRLIGATPIEIDEKTYPISHVWQGQYYQVPIHLVSFRADLDKRSEQRIQGASKASPHGMVQEFLNRSVHDLWAFVSNGLKLLILRDNASLTRQAYVEFDLESIFEGEAYADFRLLWMVCHQSRLEGTAKDRPETCWLELWSKQAQTEGRRALDRLRDGVQRALESLGTGFICHKANQNLCQRLKAGELNKQDLYRQLLRLVYRLIFLFVAEDRDLLHSPGASEEARSRYARFYSGQRLRRMAERTRGSRHADLWVGLRLVFARLGDDRGCPELGLPALGGFLFGPEAMPELESAELANEHLLLAIRNLGLVKDRSGWRLVDYRNLGSEELGSVYESLLELNPAMELDAGIFTLGTVAGNQRKTSGSYYTPDSLVQCLLDSALDPVVEQAIKGKTAAEAEKAILALKVCDPAVGSGHFLVGAAHRLAKHLAQVRAQAQGESEPSPLYYQRALRDVIGHCLYGVDVNPMAAELCRVSLWLEAIEPGKPLSFLDHHIRVGNSLLGATPALLAKGIPDEAFAPIEGDDKEVCSRFKKVNKTERIGYRRLFAATTEPWERLGDLAASMTHLDNAPDDSIKSVRNKERMYEAMVRSGNYLDGQFWADTWCAAFVWKKTQEFNHPITEEVFRRIEKNPHASDSWMRVEVERLARQYQFFHWHLAFPDVFHVSLGGHAENEQTGWSGGFDAVLGNPPWERVKLQEKEWFSERSPEIANAPNAAARRKLIVALETENPVLLQAFRNDLRATEGEGHLLRNSDRFPLCGKGDINTYAVFAETNLALLRRSGRSGCIVPSGIATDNTTKEFFASLNDSHLLFSLYDFENSVGLFEGVGHGRFKFCLLTVAGSCQTLTTNPDFFFFAQHTTDLEDQDRHFTLTADDIALINPNTLTCPIFRSKRDAEITKAIYRRVPVLIKEGPPEENLWGIKFSRMFDMANDSHLFRTQEDLAAEGHRLLANVFELNGKKHVPLYEAKMMYLFTHRYGDYAMRPKGSLDTELPRIPAAILSDPYYAVQPRYWVDEWEVIKATSNVPRLLIRAVEEMSEELALQIISVWFEGHTRAISQKEPEKYALILPDQRSRHLIDDATRRRFEAMLLHEQYPLDDSDLHLQTPGTAYLEVAERLIYKRTPTWLFGFRATTNATNERTTLFTVLPAFAVPHKFQIVSFARPSAERCALLCSNANSFVLDYISRQKVAGTDMSYFYIQQLPLLAEWQYSRHDAERIKSLFLELTFTSWDIAPFARMLGYSGPPFRWYEDRRFMLRCELDALYFRLYDVARNDVEHIMDTFPITRGKEEKQFGEYRTKRVILEIYDATAKADRTGIPYQTRLSPPPADASVAHPWPEELIQVAAVSTDRFSEITVLPDEAWATPVGVTPENVALFSMIDILRTIDEAVDPERVRLAAILVRKPVLAAAFMDDAQAKQWLRLIGQEARPVRGNVIQISQFQKNGVDYPWAEAIKQLRGSGALVVDATGKWSAGVRMPVSSGQDWITGRSSIAVQLLSAIDPARVEQKLIAFNRSVEDGTARRAVS